MIRGICVLSFLFIAISPFCFSQDSPIEAVQTQIRAFNCSAEKKLNFSLIQKYEKFSFGTSTWLRKKDCPKRSGFSSCYSLYYLSNGKLTCELHYQLDHWVSTYDQLWSYMPINLPITNKCSSLHQSQKLLPKIWVQDFPLFLDQIQKTDHEIENAEQWFHSVHKQSFLSKDHSLLLANQLSEYHFFFLRGIKLNNNPVTETGHPTKGEEFDLFIKWLLNNNISYETIKTKFNHPPSHNIDKIKQKIDEVDPEKKIIFITHSKGGLDLMEFLMRYPLYWATENAPVKGWIPFQTPFWGSTLANKSVASMGMQFVTFFWRMVENLDPEFTPMLTTEKAIDRFCENKNPKSFAKDVVCSQFFKIINVRTWLDSAKKHTPFFHKVFNKTEKEPCDGYVYYPFTQLPCVPYVSLKGFHHLDISNRMFKKFSDGEYTQLPLMQSLVSMLLDQM